MSDSGSAPRIDSITLEVVKNALASTADEMALVIMRSAYSPVVRDTMDYSTALCDRKGRVVAQGLTLAGYLISGAINRPVLALAIWVLPLVLVPSLLGSRLYSRLSVRGFQRVVLILLFLSGLALLAQAAPKLLLH